MAFPCASFVIRSGPKRDSIGAGADAALAFSVGDRHPLQKAATRSDHPSCPPSNCRLCLGVVCLPLATESVRAGRASGSIHGTSAVFHRGWLTFLLSRATLYVWLDDTGAASVRKEGIVKRITVAVLVVCMLFVLASTSVLAGGDKVRGERGEGAVTQVQVQDPPPFQ